MPTNAAAKLDPATLARIETLELRAQYIVDGYLTGLHRSPYRGQSVEFAEHREYVPGDDLRYVDWKLFGRSDRVYVKQFEAETNLSVHLAVDVSESMLYQSDDAALSKHDYADCAAVALAHLVVKQQDSVGLTIFDDQLRDYVPPSGNPTQLGLLVEVMDRASSHGPSDLGKALHELSSRIRRRGVVVVISDLLGDVDSLLWGLRHLRHQRHEVVVVQILDPAELEFPFERATLFRGLESLPQVVVEPRAIRTAYLAAMKEFLGRIEGGCRAHQIDYQLARTDEALDAPLRRLLTARSSRRG